MISLKIWRMEDEERVEVFQGRIKEERFQFVQDGDTTYMVQLGMPKTHRNRGKAPAPAKRETSPPTPPKTPCPYCGRSFLVGRGLNRHLSACPKKPKTGGSKKKPQKQAPATKTQEAQAARETKEQAP